ncbi:tetratricopeptide repeat protein [Clostridium ganghwense]|uniref:Tetratricopeptide repeat protein n=1 Tax=Clostridium ganghwense TaxID=312089 RepID=A0ABT4CSW3_9CLOT|nr:hypothetical protein [Clostridium ganghwense]MCY6371518.1 hypothetical protein [Clostridium ganghwense]
MFKKISLKSKVIIFMIAALIAVGIIVKEGINNRKRDYVIDNKINSKTENVEIKDSEDRNKANLKNITNEEKNTVLEEKYKKGYEAFHNRKYEEAIKIQNEVISKDENYYKAYSIKGIALCFQGNYEDGMKAIDKALEINADYGYGRFNKALAYELYRHYDKALMWYDKALEVENYIWSYYGKASIYGRRGDVKNTVNYLKIAIDMDSSVKNLAKEERDFNNVRESKEFKEIVK